MLTSTYIANTAGTQVIGFLSGEQGKGKGMEVSYTKEQQKQKAVLSNKVQDSDTMEVLSRRPLVAHTVVE